MQVEETGTPRHGKAKPRWSPEKVGGILIGIAMLLTVVVAVPVILHQTVGIGNYGLYFVAMILGVLLGTQLGAHIIGVGMLIVGWVFRARLIFAVVGALVVRGTDYSPRLTWDSRKWKYSGIYVATYGDRHPTMTTIRLQRYSHLIAIIPIAVMALAVVALSSIGMLDWMTRVAVVAVAIMFVGVVGSYFYAIAMPGLRDPASLERESALYQLATHEALGIRPQDFDSTSIETLVSIPDGSRYELGGWLIAAERALDLGDLDEADRAITRATLIASPLHSTLASSTYRDAAFLAAYRDNDAAAARIWLKQTTDPAFEEHTEARVEAAILLAEGELARAHETAMRGIAALDRTISPGSAALDEKYLKEILSRIDTIAAQNLMTS
jgi:hypothetical protein